MSENKCFSGTTLPIKYAYDRKCGLQVMLDVIVIGVPNAASGKKTFRLLDVQNAVLSSPFINIAKEKVVPFSPLSIFLF